MPRTPPLAMGGTLYTAAILCTGVVSGSVAVPDLLESEFPLLSYLTPLIFAILSVFHDCPWCQCSLRG